MRSIVNAVQRGVAGYLTMVAAQRGWGTNSELALYPQVREIFSGRNWDARCQWKLPKKKAAQGAPRTIDFVARSCGAEEWEVAIEIKRLRCRSDSREINVKRDLTKLLEFKRIYPKGDAYLIIFGRKKELERGYVNLDKGRLDLLGGNLVVCDVGITSWGSVAIRL